MNPQSPRQTRVSEPMNSTVTNPTMSLRCSSPSVVVVVACCMLHVACCMLFHVVAGVVVGVGVGMCYSEAHPKKDMNHMKKQHQQTLKKKHKTTKPFRTSSQNMFIASLRIGGTRLLLWSLGLPGCHLSRK